MKNKCLIIWRCCSEVLDWGQKWLHAIIQCLLINGPWSEITNVWLIKFCCSAREDPILSSRTDVDKIGLVMLWKISDEQWGCLTLRTVSSGSHGNSLTMSLQETSGRFSCGVLGSWVAWWPSLQSSLLHPRGFSPLWLKYSKKEE